MSTQTIPMKAVPSFLQTLMILLLSVMYTGDARAQEPAAPAPAGRDYVLTLAGGLPKDRPLVVYLHENGGAFLRAFALGPSFNKAAYGVRYEALKLDGDRLHGKIEVQVRPDLWTPPGRKTVECAYVIDAQVTDGAVTGTFTGTFGTTDVKGAVSGKIVPAAGASAPGHIQCWVGEEFFGDFNGADPTCVSLAFGVRDGKPVGGYLNATNPDIGTFTGDVEKMDVRFDGFSLTGAITAKAWQWPKNVETLVTYTMKLDAGAIGGRVAGDYKVTATTGLEKTGYLLGDFIPGPPADAAHGILLLGFQAALKNKSPLTVRMALSDHGENHGSAVAPWLNHQPHGVDGSRLKVSAEALKGPITVSFRHDCYYDFDPFTNEYEIDARVMGAEVVGTYKGVDRGVPVSGNIAGELRAKQPPVLKPDLSNLASVELSLRWSVGKPHGDLKFTYDQGKLQRTEVSYEKKEPKAPPRFDRADVKIVDDHLCGVVELSANLEGTEEKFRYAFSAIIEGAAIAGYWSGERAGKGIYTKSSKMWGRLTLVTPGVPGVKPEAQREGQPK